jgi:hypothetical protein
MDVHDSHAWMLRERGDLDGRRPVDLLDEGRLSEILDLIDAE